MRVARIEIKNHPSLGNLDIDLRDSSGKAARLVVIAGENGCGKTAVLEMISRCLRSGLAGKNLGEIHCYVETNKVFTPIPSFAGRPGAAPPRQADPDADRFLNSNPNFRGVLAKDPGPLIMLPRNEIVSDIKGLQLGESEHSCFYSNASVTFPAPSAVQSHLMVVDDDPTLARSGPVPSGNPRVADANLCSSAAELFAALARADEHEVHEWVVNHPGETPPLSLIGRRIKRFSEAFARIMTGKRFERVVSTPEGYRAIFKQNNHECSLGDLSTGEKQIVFRGTYLLRMVNFLPGSVVLIDEPELSLHPNWQSKILEYYDGIVAEMDNKTSQIIVATHSPFLVHGSPTAKHVVLRRDPQSGTVSVDPTPSYRGVTTGEIAISAFDLQDFTVQRRGNRLALIVEGPTDAKIIEEAWRRLRPEQEPTFNLLPARNANNVQSLLGNEIGVSGPLAAVVSSLGIDRLIGLFDFDGEGFGNWKGVANPDKDRADDIVLGGRGCSRLKRKGCLVWSALLPVPQFRSEYADHDLGAESRLTIELLFPDTVVRPLLTEVRNAGSQTEKRLKATGNGQKNAVANACTSFDDSAFDAFRPIFDLVDHVLAYTPPS